MLKINYIFIPCAFYIIYIVIPGSVLAIGPKVSFKFQHRNIKESVENIHIQNHNAAICDITTNNPHIVYNNS